MGKKKLKNRGGFTLAETLLAVTILLLVSTIVATGMPAAKNAYEKVVLASNAEVLLSTAASALRDELGTAWNVKKIDSKTVTYFSADTGMRSKLYIASDGKIRVDEYVTDSTMDSLLGTLGTSTQTDRELVFQSNNESVKLTVTATSFDVTDGKVTINGLRIEKDGSPITTMDMPPIHVFSVDTTPAT